MIKCHENKWLWKECAELIGSDPTAYIYIFVYMCIYIYIYLHTTYHMYISHIYHMSYTYIYIYIYHNPLNTLIEVVASTFD